MSADLHCHTRLSDGSLGIDDLILLAKSRGVDTIAITDKNCQAGNVRAKLIGERHGVQVIHGVEISSVDPDNGKEVNILCYLPDSPDRLEGLCRRNTLACRKASQFMVVNTAKRFSITTDIIVKCASGSTNIYIPHIMRALMECGYASSIYGDVYDELFSLESKNGIFVQAKYAPTSEVIEAIHEAGGVAVLAHSGLFGAEEIEKYISLGLDGIEVWSPYNDEETTDALLKLAKKTKILALGGSDFHGMYGKTALSVGEYSTPQKNLDELFAYKARRKRLQKKAEVAAAAAAEALAATVK